MPSGPRTSTMAATGRLVAVDEDERVGRPGGGGKPEPAVDAGPLGESLVEVESAFDGVGELPLHVGFHDRVAEQRLDVELGDRDVGARRGPARRGRPGRAGTGPRRSPRTAPAGRGRRRGWSRRRPRPSARAVAARVAPRSAEGWSGVVVSSARTARTPSTRFSRSSTRHGRPGGRAGGDASRPRSVRRGARASRRVPTSSATVRSVPGSVRSRLVATLGRSRCWRDESGSAPRRRRARIPSGWRSCP